MNALPFTISGVYLDFANLEGIARLDESGLILEFSVKDALVGVLKSKPKEVRLVFADIAEVTFKGGLFRGELTLQTRRMSAIADVPGSSAGRLRLRCRRKHWPIARELTSQLTLRVMAEDLRHMAAANSRPRELPNGV